VETVRKDLADVAKSIFDLLRGGGGGGLDASPIPAKALCAWVCIVDLTR